MSDQNPPPYTPLPSDAPPSYTAHTTVCGPADGQDAPPPAIEGYTPVGPAALSTVQNGGRTQSSSQSPPRPRTIPVPRSTDNIILTIIMMVLCGVLFNVCAFAFLIPALLYARKAADANRRGEYFQARKHAQTSFWFNLSAIILFIVVMLIGISIGFVFGIAKP